MSYRRSPGPAHVNPVSWETQLREKLSSTRASRVRAGPGDRARLQPVVVTVAERIGLAHQVVGVAIAQTVDSRFEPVWSAARRLLVETSEAGDAAVGCDLVVPEAIPARPLRGDATARRLEISVVVRLALEAIGELGPDSFRHLRIHDVCVEELLLRRRPSNDLLLRDGEGDRTERLRERQSPDKRVRQREHVSATQRRVGELTLEVRPALVGSWQRP